jgi:beta-lysine 5,6-aminomutase beta subunit
MKIRPYGDTNNDGKIQLSFTLPISAGGLATEAAKQFAKQLGMADPNVVLMENIGENFTFFIVYGTVGTQVDLSTLKVEEIETPTMDRESIEKLIAQEFDRDLVFVGASTGTDAHTVGIDAIMNMKGYAGHYGLERYQHINAYNLGSQVPNEIFIQEAKRLHADVLLGSQTVTQKDILLRNLTELVDLLEAEHMRNDVILVCGGARISHELAKELGYDAGFGPKKYAEDVASFAVLELIRRKKQK